MRGRKPLRGVMAGAGHFAGIQLDAWSQVEGGGISGLYDLDADKTSRLGKTFGATAYAGWEKMAEEERPDFVDICTPPVTHGHYVKLAADLGLPILCQKMLAPTYEEAAELVGYCRERGVPLMVNENWRWQAWYREMKKLIGQGMLGRVYTAYFAMRPGDGWGEQPYPVQPYFKEMEKFLLFETGVHFIDTFRYLFGEIESVYCRTDRINPVIRGEDLAIAVMHFADGVTAIYDANRSTYMEEVRSPAYGWMTLEGTEGKLRLQEDGRIFYTPRGGTEREHLYPIPANGWKGGCTIAAQQHFIDCLRTGAPFETSGEHNLTTIRAVFACYESASRKQAVPVNRQPGGLQAENEQGV